MSTKIMSELLQHVLFVTRKKTCFLKFLQTFGIFVPEYLPGNLELSAVSCAYYLIYAVI